LWAADKLRSNMDAAEYKHVVLGLIFLKYISDASTAKYRQLTLEFADPKSPHFIKEAQQRYLAVEDCDEYAAENIFWVPPEARWEKLQAAGETGAAAAWVSAGHAGEGDTDGDRAGRAAGAGLGGVGLVGEVGS